MNLRKFCSVVLGLLLLAAAGAWAHVRLINPSNGLALWWQTPGAISIVINDAGSDDLADDSHFTALRNAIDAWNSIDNTTLQLVEDSSPAAQARTDWSSSSLHLLYFDENNSSGYFPNGSSTVAITPVWFYSNGRIADADVLFNGKTFAFTTSAQSGRYDIQDVAVHELGHLLGLDHSGWAGSSMYPYVDTTVSLHRSLSLDESRAMAQIYPSGTTGHISGTIRRDSDNSVVSGAHVVARDGNGRPTGAVLTSSTGDFDIGGLLPGNYTLYATPLDYPVASNNLGSGWVIETDFESTQFGSVTISGGETQSTGTTLVGANVFVSLGRNSDPYPLRCPRGVTTSIIVRGSGLNTGSTLTASDPSVSVSVTAWYGSQVNLDVTIPGGANVGHVDLTVVNPAGKRSILSAPLEITPQDPTLTFVSPNQGSDAGGTNLTLTGTNFYAGARVVMGGQIYVDGAAGGCTVLSDTTITLTTRASTSGLTDVVLIDGTGVEGRKSNGYQFLSVPIVYTIYPAAGSSNGGTLINLIGDNFSFSTVVRINGVAQGAAFAVSEQKLSVFTAPGTAGGPYTVEIENPGGSIATTQFSYIMRADPVVTTINPSSGSISGGDLLTISGSNFGADLDVIFGADPDTGLGGTSAASVLWIDATTIEVTTPALAAGSVSVIVEDNLSAQASITSSGFTFLGVSSSGGGGCYTVPVSGPPDPGQVLRSLLWFALMAWGIRRVAGHRAPKPCPERISS